MNPVRLSVCLWMLVLCVAMGMIGGCDRPAYLTGDMEDADNDDVVWQGRTIAEWRWDLRRHLNPEAAAIAARVLVEAGQLAVPGLAKDVNSDDMLAAHLAAMALFEMGPTASEAIPALESAIKRATNEGKDAPDLRILEVWCRAAVVRISTRQEDHVDAIAGFVSDEDDGVRIEACKALGELGAIAAGSLPSLRAVRSAGSEDVRKAAAEAMDQIATGRPDG